MKFVVAFVALVVVVTADVSHIVNPEATAQVVSQSQDVDPVSFKFDYETSNGIKGEASGVLNNVGKENEALVQKGYSSYKSPEGQVIETIYVADENGYQPQGSHLPTPPPTQPIPEYILKSIAYNAANAKPESLARRN